MVVKYKKTFFALDIKKTDINDGLHKDDCWCQVTFIVDNDEFHYEVSRMSLAYHELIYGCEKIRNYYNDGHGTKLKFITNFFTIDLVDTKDDNRLLRLNLISLQGKKHQSYSIEFENDEILEFLKKSVVKDEEKQKKELKHEF